MPDLSQARFNGVDKPLSFSNIPKLEWNSIQASLVLPVFRNQQSLLQATMVHPEFVRINSWFHSRTSLLETKTRSAFRLTRSRSNRGRVCSTVLWQIHLPITVSHSFEEPEAIVWKDLRQSLITQIRVDYSMKILAKCKSGLSTTNTTIPSCLMTWTVIDNFLEKFWKAVGTGISLQFSMPREISTS